MEDEALTITEDAVLDTSFVTRVQEIVTTLSPMDRVVFRTIIILVLVCQRLQ